MVIPYTYTHMVWNIYTRKSIHRAAFYTLHTKGLASGNKANASIQILYLYRYLFFPTIRLLIASVSQLSVLTLDTASLASIEAFMIHRNYHDTDSWLIIYLLCRRSCMVVSTSGDPMPQICYLSLPYFAVDHNYHDTDSWFILNVIYLLCCCNCVVVSTSGDPTM